MTTITPRLDPPDYVPVLTSVSNVPTPLRENGTELLDIVSCTDARYEATRAFAFSIYRKRYGVNPVNQPDVILTLSSDGDLVGCLGLNHSLKCRMFSDDHRLLDFCIETGTHPDSVISHAVLAVDKSLRTLRLLLGAAAAYAQHTQKQKIVYAGAGTFAKAIRSLGFAVDVLGPVNIDLVPQHERPGMDQWQELCDPQLSIMETTHGVQVCDNRLNRFGVKVGAAWQSINQTNTVSE